MGDNIFSRNWLEFFLVIIFGLLPVGYGVFQLYKAKIAEESADDYNARLLRSQDSLVISQSELLNESKQTNEKQSELIEIQKKLEIANQLLINQQEETLKFVTGEGYPQLILMDINHRESRLTFRNYSKYPMFNVSSRIAYIDVIKKECKITDNIIDRVCVKKHTIEIFKDETLRQEGGGYIWTDDIPNINYPVHVEITVMTRTLAVKYRTTIINGIMEYRVYKVDIEGIYTEIDKSEPTLNLPDQYWINNFLPNGLKLYNYN